jgi:hypothetical protein
MELNPVLPRPPINLGNFAPPAEKSKKFCVIAIAPKEEASYRAVFGREMTASASRQLETFQQRLITSHQDVHFISGLFEAAADDNPFQQAISHAQTNTVVVTGHSVLQDGQQVLILPDGKSVKLDDLYKTAAQYRKDLVVVTCRGGDITPGRDISFNDVGKLLEKLGSNHVADDHQEVIKFLNHQYKTMRMKSNIQVAGLSTAVAGNATFVWKKLR